MNERIKLDHGSGGLLTKQLIEEIFMKHIGNSWLQMEGDSAILEFNSHSLAFSTDSFVVDPFIFPGGDIGKLAVCGTVNDLAVAGAVPLYLSAGFIIEEGLEMLKLEQIIESMALEADVAGIHIVAGDTKVVEHGKADGLFINTSGIGTLEECNRMIASGKHIEVGDAVIVNGTLGDHEAAIINAREHLFEESTLHSDCASLNGLIKELLSKCKNVHFMRDITRGGLAGILHEIANLAELGFQISEQFIPVADNVAAFCETLGFDPLQMACEGRFLLIVPEEDSGLALQILKNHGLGQDAAQIGRVGEGHPGEVILHTVPGGRRLLEPPRASKVPRIC